MLDGLVVEGPAGAIGQKDQADNLYAALEAKWGWGPEVTKYLREELECETLHDLLGALKSARDWDEFYRADIKLPAGAQVSRTKRSRVSQCHEHLIKTQKTAADIKAKGEEAVDFDKLLGTEIIKKKIQAFWDRHRLNAPIKKMPGDTLISRTSKEIERRFLHVTDLMKIKGVIWERRAETKKEKVGEQLYMERTPDSQDEDRAEGP